MDRKRRDTYYVFDCYRLRGAARYRTRYAWVAKALAVALHLDYGRPTDGLR